VTLKEKLARARRRLKKEQELESYLEAVKSGSRFAAFYQDKADAIQRDLEDGMELHRN
jgi:hypothetical protein